MPPARNAYRINRLQAAGVLCFTLLGVSAIGYSACVIDPMGTGPLLKQTATTTTSSSNGTAGGTTTTTSSGTSGSTTTSNGGMGGTTTSGGGGVGGGTGGGGTGGMPTVAGSVAAGHEHSCAALSDGSARCWGDGEASQLGNGASVDSLVPVSVSNFNNFTQVVAAAGHSCGLEGGSAYCWGGNTNGVLGDNNPGTPSNVPVQVLMLSNIVELSASAFHSCARLMDGKVHCWGKGQQGQLGNGAAVDSPVPVAVTGLPAPAVSIAAGNDHSCAVLNNGDAYCWGYDTYGELGDGTTGGFSTTPTKVVMLSNAISIVARAGVSCAVVQGALAYCWGRNNRGQLGVGNKIDSPNPQLVSGLTNVKQMALGYSHSCALHNNGQVSCWGANENGNVGVGSVSGEYTTPQTSIQDNVAQIDLGSYHSCAYLYDGKVRCWGGNAQGQLGNNATMKSGVPVSPQGL